MQGEVVTASGQLDLELGRLVRAQRSLGHLLEAAVGDPQPCLRRLGEDHLQPVAAALDLPERDEICPLLRIVPRLELGRGPRLPDRDPGTHRILSAGLLGVAQHGEEEADVLVADRPQVALHVATRRLGAMMEAQAPAALALMAVGANGVEADDAMCRCQFGIRLRLQAEAREECGEEQIAGTRGAREGVAGGWIERMMHLVHGSKIGRRLSPHDTPGIARCPARSPRPPVLSLFPLRFRFEESFP